MGREGGRYVKMKIIKWFGGEIQDDFVAFWVSRFVATTLKLNRYKSCMPFWAALAFDFNDFSLLLWAKSQKSSFIQSKTIKYEAFEKKGEIIKRQRANCKIETEKRTKNYRGVRCMVSVCIVSIRIHRKQYNSTTKKMALCQFFFASSLEQKPAHKISNGEFIE